ncbi:MAG: hypothetical protein AAF471_03325 [Myxococcota bacterium]
MRSEKIIRATAPGSVMLLGEHAVLRGKQAIVAAVDRRIHVTLRPRADRRIVVASDLGNSATSVEECRLPPPLRFVQASLRHHQTALPNGMELTITSDLPAAAGLGSSAAVTAAVLGAVRAWLNLVDSPPQAAESPYSARSGSFGPRSATSCLPCLPHRGSTGASSCSRKAVRSPKSIEQGSPQSTGAIARTLCGAKQSENFLGLNEAVAVIRRVQGMGSGADAAASLFGGTLLFQSHPAPTVAERFDQAPPIVLCASGAKTPTPRVVEHVEQFRRQHPRVVDAIDSAIHQTVIEAASAIKRADWPSLGRLFNVNHGLMNALGVSNALLEEMVQALRGEPTIHGAKISGAGLGDCVVGLGRITSPQWPSEIISGNITNKGLVIDTWPNS